MARRRPTLRLPNPSSPYVLDGLIAFVLGSLSLISFFTIDRTPAEPRAADALGALLVIVTAASLTFRRRWPVAVLVATTVGTAGIYLLDYPDSGLPFVVLVSLYTLASRCDWRVTVAATAGMLLVITFVIAPASDMEGGALAGALALFTMGAIWGDRKKVRDAYTEQLELRAAAKERERIEASRRAVDEERLRIAREMHDVVAHAMSVVAVQAGVGAHVIDKKPDEAKQILETISATSRESLDEMRRLLGVLRAEPSSGDATADLSSAPGLEELDVLVTRVVEAGVLVDVRVQGARGSLPVGVDLASYRIVQEALTNVLKHAGQAKVSVLVRYEPGAVHLEVLDDGRGAAAGVQSGQAPGHGLVGMRERASLYGGELEAGPRAGGGYRVAATLRYAS